MIVLYVICILIGLVCSATISGMEIAFFSLKQKELAECKTSSRPRDKKIILIIQESRKILATILIMNNLVNVSIVLISTILVRNFLKGEMTPYEVTIFTFYNTSVIVFFGELLPKVYANANNLKVSRMTVNILSCCVKIFTPLSFFLLYIGKWFEKRIKITPHTFSINDLHRAIEISSMGENKEIKIMLKGVINFGSVNVEKIMSKRESIVSCEINESFENIKNKIKNINFSRIIVYEKDIDNIQGVLYVKNIIVHIQNDVVEWKKNMKPVIFIPTTKRVNVLFNELQLKNIHTAIVVDEYARTVGLVTIDDLFKELLYEVTEKEHTDQ
ncbi:MAG: CNNM domain-containing protein [Chitinophagaceae bacterium]|nr:CNNM domain-containing protein [Chitinophagaceae bacterium]